MGDLIQNRFPGEDDDEQPISKLPPEKRHRILEAAAAAGIFFIFDKPTKKYYSTETERVVLDKTIRRYVREIGEAARSRMSSLTEKEVAGAISRADWEIAMGEEITQLHRSMAIIARGGKDAMTPRDWGRVGNVIRRQKEYLNQFGSQVAHGQVSEAQQVTRAEQYASAAYSTYENAVAVRNIESGVVRARRVLEDAAQHCDDCPDLATDEFIPIEDVVPIGESECQANCRCTIEYEDAPQDEQQAEAAA